MTDTITVAGFALGAALLDPSAFAAVRATGLTVDDLDDPAHRAIYGAMLYLADAHQPVDVVTVADELERNGAMPVVGGPGAVLDLATATPAISNAARYATYVRDDAQRRRLRLVDEEDRWKPI